MTIIDEYLTNLEESQKAVLTNFCSLVRHIVPNAEEAYSYGVPSFRYKGKYLIAFAANKKFMSIYPSSNAISQYSDLLTSFDQTKGSIHFTADEPIPVDTLQLIIKSCKSRIDS